MTAEAHDVNNKDCQICQRGSAHPKIVEGFLGSGIRTRTLLMGWCRTSTFSKHLGHSLVLSAPVSLRVDDRSGWKHSLPA